MRKLIAIICICSVLRVVQAQGSAHSKPDDSEAIEPSSAPAKQTRSTLSVASISAVVYTADGKKQSPKEGKPGEKLLKAVKLSSGQSVEVSFTPNLDGAAFKPQQAMLMAASKAHPGLAAYAVAKAKKDLLHVITLSTDSIDKQIANVGGEMELSLLLGDPDAVVGVRHQLGSVVLPEAASDAPPRPKLLTATHQPKNNLKSNIAHTFRAPDKRAPAVVSLAFTGLVGAPLLLLLGYLGMIGVNLKGLPSGAANLWVLLFHGGIAAMLLLYLLFWLQLNLAQTLPLALALGLFTAVTGYKALGALSAQRIVDAKASAAPLAVKKAS